MARGALPFALVDVFSAIPLAGNPLAVVGEADNLAEDAMRSLAREFNQSETTFVMASQRAGVAAKLRSFTAAGAEVGGAGHNALGAWWWLAQTDRLLLEAGGGRFLQEIAGRELEVEVTADANGRPKVDRHGPGGAVLGAAGIRPGPHRSRIGTRGGRSWPDGSSAGRIDRGPPPPEFSRRMTARP